MMTRLNRVGLAGLLVAATAAMVGGANLAPARASQLADPTVTVPGMEWFKAVGCMPALCVGAGANNGVSLNGTPGTLVTINPLTGPQVPVDVSGMTDINDIACKPASDPNPSCVIVGDLGGVGAGFAAEYAWVDQSGAAGPPQPVPAMTTLNSATCDPKSSTSPWECVAVGADGVAVLHSSFAAGLSEPGLGATAVGCTSPTSCVVATAAGSTLSWNPTNGTLGTPQPAPAATGHLACSTQSCELLASSGANQSTLARIDPVTGAVTGVVTIPNFDAGSLTCTTTTQCLAVGWEDVGTYPNDYLVASILPIASGVPQHVLHLTQAQGSDQLTGVSCADNSAALGPHDKQAIACVAVGSTAASSSPGVQPVGMTVALSSTGRIRSFVLGQPSAAARRLAVGELVSTDPANGDHEPCTATVIDSPLGDLIVTAAHCVQSLDDNHKFTNFYFAPDHAGPTCAQLNCGTNPEGVWTATSADLTVYPDAAHNQRFDWAFINVHPLAGELPIQRVVGALGVDFNAATSQAWTIFGYPYGAEISPGVNQLSFVQCGGTSSTADPSIVPGPGPVGLFIGPPSCDAETAGASGGPWIENSTGTVGAVNKVQNAGMGIVGTYLGTDAAHAYQQASKH
jgi:hypothetical protein